MTFWAGRRVLVTGGCGFGGGHLVTRLVALGAEVGVLDRDPEQPGVLAAGPIRRHVEVRRGDVRDETAVGDSLRRWRPQAVFHLAAQPLVPESVREPAETLAVNAGGTYTLLEAVRRDERVEAFVLASTGGYYGENHDDRPLREDDPARAGANLYGASKIAADVAVQAYARTFGLRASVCRFMNTYGPGDRQTSRLVPHAIRLLREGGPYDFGSRDDGTTRLDFLYVGDMVEGYLRVAERLATHPGACYNFGSGRPTAIRDVAQMVSQAYDGVARVPIFRGPRRDRPIVKSLDITRARTDLGWTPAVPLAEGLARTVRSAEAVPAG
ncbi:NAD-dependent epimerase/dehydratase family protein [Micromonospora sp. C32]|uniref:NAD-dependent epimerase/dehydratase family protein n=1 Tax=Micromonospora sp. C32 TaxID=2824877 RepID=UPI001B35F4AB|nr:NAD-dependent epimerase/dehydratase family protein [Micromonospora sp. C32]MBQ1055152.1 NAD-dependent epimerase/dehydratase family protein [Micromonospora sp. C32]